MQLTGELSIATTPALLEHAGVFVAQGEVNLSGVTNADSAGVAFLLELKRRAHAAGKALRFSHCPPQLAGLVRFFELEPTLLNLEVV